MIRRPPRSTLVPDTTLFRSASERSGPGLDPEDRGHHGRAEGALHGGDRDAQHATGGAHLRLRSEEHTSELQSRQYLVCRLLLEKKINLFFHSLLMLFAITFP